jgi:hypothetical protein
MGQRFRLDGQVCARAAPEPITTHKIDALSRDRIIDASLDLPC